MFSMYSNVLFLIIKMKSRVFGLFTFSLIYFLIYFLIHFINKIIIKRGVLQDVLAYYLLSLNAFRLSKVSS